MFWGSISYLSMVKRSPFFSDTVIFKENIKENLCSKIPGSMVKWKTYWREDEGDFYFLSSLSLVLYDLEKD